MSAVEAENVLSPIQREDCLSLLEGQVVGRLAVVDGGQPFVFPVNYAMAGETPVFRSADGTKMRAGEGRPVCFEVDELDVARHTGWSVMVIGWLEEVTRYHPSLFDAIEALGVTPWAGGDRPHLLRVVPRRVTGRRISAP